MTGLPAAGQIPPGTPAPAFSLPVCGRPGEVDGLPPRSARGLTLVAFYKNTCPTCRLAFPLLQRIHQRVEAAGGRVIGISQDGPSGTEAFGAELGLTFPLLIDGPDYPVSRLYGLVSVPTLYLVDPSGAIQRSGSGFAREELQTIAAEIAASVGAPGFPLYDPAESFPDFKPG